MAIIMRTAELKRKTNETDIEIYLELDGNGISEIDTGIGFLDHMLTLFSRHGRFDLNVKCKGDINVDCHHSVEDIGIALGNCFIKALNNMKGIERYAHIILPMDSVLMMCAVDISGRDYLGFDVIFPTEKIGNFDCELVKEFFLGFVRNSKTTLHFKKISGENSHHICEAMFKAWGRVMKKAVEIDEKYKDEIPSTKGVL